MFPNARNRVNGTSAKEDQFHDSIFKRFGSSINVGMDTEKTYRSSGKKSLTTSTQRIEIAPDGKRFTNHKYEIYDYLGSLGYVKTLCSNWDSMELKGYTTRDYAVNRCEYHFVIEHRGFITCPIGTPEKLGELCGWKYYMSNKEGGRDRIATYFPHEWNEVKILLDEITRTIKSNFTKR